MFIEIKKIGSELNTSPAKLARIVSITIKKLKEKNINLSQLKNAVSFKKKVYLTCRCTYEEKSNRSSKYPNRTKKKRKKLTKSIRHFR